MNNKHNNNNNKNTETITTTAAAAATAPSTPPPRLKITTKTMPHVLHVYIRNPLQGQNSIFVAAAVGS